MNIEVYNYSGKGGRPINEDSLICGKNYFIVSDGLGGHENGEVASSAAVDYISVNYRSDISENAVGELLLGADDAVRKTGAGGKATVAALFTDGDKIRISNIGDSRVYYFRKGSIFFRTKDHSVCQASVDMGEMTDIDVRNSEDRSGLFKVLGDSEPLKLPKAYDIIDPLDNDAFLICSDGFWEYVYEMEMEADLLKSASADQWLNHMLKRLLLRSENSGDNFTAICGFIHAPEKISAPLPATMAVAEIPPTGAVSSAYSVDAQEQSKRILKIIPILICATAAVIAAIILLIAINGEGGKVLDGSDGQSDFEITFSFDFTDQTEETDISEGTEDSGKSEFPEGTGTPGEIEFPEETGITGEIEFPGVTEISEETKPIEPIEESEETETTFPTIVI